MQESRLFQILYRLMREEVLTAPMLAREFEVSVRTIYRDIDRLSAAGIPVHTVQGKGGGIRLLPGFVLDKLLMSEAEQRELLSALQGLSAAAQPEAEALLCKLHALFPAQRTDWIEADFTRWGSNAAERERFELLKNAILNRRVIAFDYRAGCGGFSRREVQPAKLCFKHNAWYLQGFCLTRMAYRTFKISRMSGLCATQRYFETVLTPPPIDDLYAPNSQASMLSLHFTKEIAARVYDEFDSEHITPLPDGSLRVYCEMPLDQWLCGYMLSFGADVTIEAPAVLHEAVVAQARKIMEQARQT